MKTLKYKGKEYKVIDVFFVDGNVLSLSIFAVIKIGGLMDIVEFNASYFKKMKVVTVEFEQQYMTKRTAEILCDYSAQ